MTDDNLEPLYDCTLYNPSAMRAIDLYSGVGGWSLGLRMAGIKVVRSFEWWNEANATHNANFGTKHGEVDIRKLQLRDLDDLGKIDIVVGSPPCTQFSFSNRGGAGDIQDGLKDIKKFLEIVEYLEPKYWAMENVPRVAGILQQCLLPGCPLARFQKLVTVVEVVDAAEFGVPQNRKRMIAGNFPLDLFQSYKVHARKVTLGDVIECLATDPAIDPVYGFRLTGKKLTDHDHEPELSAEERRLNEEAKRFHPVYNLMQFPDRLDRPSRTVTATCTRVSRESIVIRDPQTKALRRLTVRERASVQSFPITFQFFGSTYQNRQKMVGNAVPPFLTYQIACSMRGVAADDLRTPKAAAQVHPMPAKVPAPVRVEAPGKRYPANRGFRAALPGLRFGSGVRFDLSNSFGNDQTHWRVGFYYGSSKDIRAVELSAELEARLLKGLSNETRLKVLRELIDLDVAPTEDFEANLQAVWTRQGRGKGPFQIVDQLAERAEAIRRLLVRSYAYCEACVARELQNKTPSKLRANAAEVISGMLVGARFNALLSAKRSEQKGGIITPDARKTDLVHA